MQGDSLLSVAGAVSWGVRRDRLGVIVAVSNGCTVGVIVAVQDGCTVIVAVAVSDSLAICLIIAIKDVCCIIVITRVPFVRCVGCRALSVSCSGGFDSLASRFDVLTAAAYPCPRRPLSPLALLRRHRTCPSLLLRSRVCVVLLSSPSSYGAGRPSRRRCRCRALSLTPPARRCRHRRPLRHRTSPSRILLLFIFRLLFCFCCRSCRARIRRVMAWESRLFDLLNRSLLDRCGVVLVLFLVSTLLSHPAPSTLSLYRRTSVSPSPSRSSGSL